MKREAIRHVVRNYILESNNPDVTAYGGTFLRHYGRNAWMIRYMMSLGAMRRCRVLDVGCGFGWQALIVALAGENDVVANDIRPSMIDVVRSQTASLDGVIEAGRVTPLLGDICSLELEPASFDAIFCNQTVEHLHDLPRFFAAAARVLKPGGRMVIGNDNNALNRRHFAAVSNMWALRDRSHDYIERLKRERPIENADIEPYAVMRERIIRRANPALSANEVRRLADATAGLVAPEIVDVARRYAPGAALPTPPRYAWSRNPVTGEYCERQLNPFELAAEIDRAGFTSRVLHAFRQPPLRLLNGVRFRPLNRQLFARRGVFVIRSMRR